jgi:hypothetical protein
MSIDVVQLVRDGKGRFEWTEVRSEHKGYQLFPSVMRDAMKFDGMPAMNWKRQPIAGDTRTFDGVRMPATAHELQQIADLLGAMLMTPKVIGHVWTQAGLQFNSIVNIAGKIVAVSNIHDVHQAIEAAIKAAGGDDGSKLISCVGKYWCLIEDLIYKGKVAGDWAACNYGWFGTNANGASLTPGAKCWQRPGFAHNKLHWDPSQTIRLMYRRALLVHPDGTEEDVDLLDILQNPDLAPLLTHDEKPLSYLRQKGVPEEEPLPTHGIITLPEITITGRRPKDIA